MNDIVNGPSQHEGESGLGWVIHAQSYGTAVYPATVSGGKYGITGLARFVSEEFVTTELRWFARSPRLVFVAKAGTDYALISVDFRRGVPGTVTRRAIDARAFLDPADEATVLQKALAKFVPITVEIIDDRRVSISIRPDLLSARTRIILPLP
jgi:hypothetical protein